MGLSADADLESVGLRLLLDPIVTHNVEQNHM